MDGENALLDEGFGPDAVEEFLLADEPPGSPDKRDEQVERFRRKSDGLAAPASIVRWSKPLRRAMSKTCPAFSRAAPISTRRSRAMAAR